MLRHLSYTGMANAQGDGCGKVEVGHGNAGVLCRDGFAEPSWPMRVTGTSHSNSPGQET